MTTSPAPGGKKKGKKIFEKTSKTLEADKALESLSTSVEQFDPAKASTFEQYPLSSETKQGLKLGNYEKPTPIQRESIHKALVGRDILGAAKTGSGKTLAFVIPILEKLYKLKWGRSDGVGALIISPTRELATQIFEVLRKVGKFHSFQTGLIVGGSNQKCVQREQDVVARNNIIVCTPGRLLDHIEHAVNFNMDELQILVLDEADRLLEVGFQATLEAIVESLPRERQTLLFSATQTKSVKDLAKLSLKSPVYVSPDEQDDKSTPDLLEELYVVCELQQKLNFLWSFIRQHLKKKIIVFFSTCKQVRFVYEVFCRMRPGIPLMRLHGARKQHHRLTTYKEFCRKQFAILFATDVAARGLDISSVHWVVQMDCPSGAVTYIHRAGRTARNEKTGNSLLVLLPSEEEAMLEELTRKRVVIKRCRANPQELESVIPRIQSLCSREEQLQEFATAAYTAYLKNLALYSSKKIFNVKALPIEEFAKSLGLIFAPRLKFLEKLGVTLWREKKNPLFYKNESDEESGDTEDKHQLIGDNSADESGDDEPLMVKRLQPSIAPDGFKSAKPIRETKSKPITKVAEIKKLLKTVKPKRVVFDDEGQFIKSDCESSANAASNGDNDALDHAADRKLYKERLAEARNLKKQKLKEKRKSEKKDLRENVGVKLKVKDDIEDEDETQKKKKKLQTPKLKKLAGKEKKHPRNEEESEEEEAPKPKKAKSETSPSKDDLNWLACTL